MLLLACGEAAGPGAAPARVDYVDGAIQPILVRGQAVVIEGFGFGEPRGDGAVWFPRAGGGLGPATVADSDWTDFAIRATVPDSAVSGPLSVVTAAGGRLTATVHVLPRVPFDAQSLSWTARTPFPGAPVGVALAAAEFVSQAGGPVTAALYAAGGAEPIGGDSVMAPDARVFVTRAQAGGAIGAWRGQSFQVARAFAAAAVATPHNSHAAAGVLYVVGGIDTAGRAQSTVLAAEVSADSVVGQFVTLQPLPAPTAGASAVIRRGRLYVIGGTDSLGRPHRRVFVGRIGADGRIDGWYVQPELSGTRAYGGAVVLDRRIYAFGGVADSVPPGGGLDSTPARLVTADTAPVSLVSGFFTGSWATAAALLPEGRSQFAPLDLGDVVLAVGGLYAGAAANAAETIAATVVGDTLGSFAGPVGTTTIAGLDGGTLVGPAGAAWREAGGGRHGLVLGGMDLATRQRRAGTWGF